MKNGQFFLSKNGTTISGLETMINVAQNNSVDLIFSQYLYTIGQLNLPLNRILL